jgi:hypothetical protein
MSDIINSLIHNLEPNNIYNNYNYLYNEIYNEVYNIKDDFYTKIINYINETNETNKAIDTSYKTIDINYSNNYNLNYLIAFQIILYYVITIFLSFIIIKKVINKSDPNNNCSITNDTVNEPIKNNTVINPIINDDSKLYLGSLIEIAKNNSKIMSQLKTGINYIVILRIKLKHYLNMKNTKYNLNNKYIKNNYNNTDFSTKDMYMIMGFNYNNQHKHFTHIIVNFINHLNSISEEKYKNEDFIVVAAGSVNDNIPGDFIKGINNIKYELFNLVNVIFNLKNDNFIKYTLTLPIHNVNNMILDIFNETIFESKYYTIDKNNNERWNGIPLNEISDW